VDAREADHTRQTIETTKAGRDLLIFRIEL
jgi:hypothetical protein